MILYFTGTGNSRWAAARLAEALNDEMVDSLHWMKTGVPAEFESEKPWVFVCPTYAWQMPRVFADFLRGAELTGSREAYFVLTCGSEEGDAANGAQELCAEKGLAYRGLLSVAMPENYIALFDVPGEEACAAMLEKARPMLTACAAHIRAGKALPMRPVTAADRLKSGAVNGGFYRYYVKDKAFYATDACVGCGRCVQLCPLNNITLEEGRPVWNGDCTHCMACICHCPAEAIEYGKISRGKRRYLCPEE